VQLVDGYTPETVKSEPKIMEGSRLEIFQRNEPKKFPTKRACVLNHVRFWTEVVDSGVPQAFIEHDAVAIAPPEDWKFKDVLVLNMDFAFKFGALRGKFNWKPQSTLDKIVEIGHTYPLKCKVPNSPYKGSSMVPGTAAYAIMPEAAERMLLVAEEFGLEQSDYILNDMNVTIEYVNPSPVRFNSKNLQTSHG
jgi:GR25 family glycosyltransferase involved in LPS biosynthesis